MHVDIKTEEWHVRVTPAESLLNVLDIIEEIIDRALISVDIKQIIIDKVFEKKK